MEQNYTLLFYTGIGLLLILYGYLNYRIEKQRTILTKDRKKGIINGFIRKSNKLQKLEQSLDHQFKTIGLKMKSITAIKLIIGVFILNIIIGVKIDNVPITLIATLFFVLIPKLIIDIKVNKKEKQYNEQIQEAIELFVAEYSIVPSLTTALDNVVDKLKFPLRNEFELLIRKLKSGESFEKAFVSFYERTNNKWIMIFSQLMISFYKKGGDITPYLIQITQNIINERIESTQNNTEIASLKWTNIILNAAIPFIYAINLILIPEATQAYSSGPGKIVMVVALTFSAVSLYLGLKITKQ